MTNTVLYLPLISRNLFNQRSDTYIHQFFMYYIFIIYFVLKLEQFILGYCIQTMSISSTKQYVCELQKKNQLFLFSVIDFDT